MRAPASCRSTTTTSRPSSMAAVGRERLAVERVDDQAGLLIAGRFDAIVGFAADAVLGAEQGRQRHAGRLGEQIDRARAVARTSGLVGEQADALALEPREVLRRQHVDAGEHAPSLVRSAIELRRGRPNHLRREGRDSALGSSRDVLRRQQRGGRDRRDFGAQRCHVAFAVGVDAIRQEHHVALRRGIEPQRGAGESKGCAASVPGAWRLPRPMRMRSTIVCRPSCTRKGSRYCRSRVWVSRRWRTSSPSRRTDC